MIQRFAQGLATACLLAARVIGAAREKGVFPASQGRTRRAARAGYCSPGSPPAERRGAQGPPGKRLGTSTPMLERGHRILLLLVALERDHCILLSPSSRGRPHEAALVSSAPSRALSSLQALWPATSLRLEDHGGARAGTSSCPPPRSAAGRSRRPGARGGRSPPCRARCKPCGERNIRGENSETERTHI